MSIPIVGQGVSTQATSGFLQSTAGLGGRMIGVFQNKYLAATTLCMTMFILIRVIDKVCPKIFESKFVKTVSAKIFEKRTEKYDSSRHAIAWISASIIMIVGTLGISRLLQLPFSRGTTLAVQGWTLFSFVVYNTYIRSDRDDSDDSDDGEIHYAVEAPSDSNYHRYTDRDERDELQSMGRSARQGDAGLRDQVMGNWRTRRFSESDSDDDIGVTEPPRRRQPPSVQPMVNEQLMDPFFQTIYPATKHPQDVTE